MTRRSAVQVALHNAGDLHGLAADKGYDWQELREKLREEDVRPLIKHCEFRPIDHAHRVTSATDEYSASVFSTMTGVRRFEVVEHLSNTELDEAIEEAQQADETRLVRRLCLVKSLYEEHVIEEFSWLAEPA